MTGQLQEKIIDFFFPRHCVGCGKIGDLLCPGCSQKLPRLLPPFCQKCGKHESSGVLCPACWGQQTDIDGIRSVFRFEGTVRRAVHDLKYRNLKSIAICLATLMADYMRDNPVPGDVLVPVPLHPRRLRERGYNQSSLLANKLGKLTALPVLEGKLCRLKDSLPQARTTTVEERRKNVRKAFKCQHGKLQGKAFILIDDVCTSGATLESCAAALKAAGAVSVWGFTLAREI
ncbi:MAG: ComF family protein [Dehalococcoidia bacterium]|nr:ComF family protein [Dehalococcoidia bacterium]